MHKPNFITFTGADDPRDLPGMIGLSELYPIEWGILFSRKKIGTPRYPGIDYVHEFIDMRSNHVKFSAHICGSFAKTILRGDHPGLCINPSFFQRAQINLGTEPRSSNEIAIIMRWAAVYKLKPILQCERFPWPMHVQYLYDCSGGTGKAPRDPGKPESWPDSPGSVENGYAGGINPSNVAAVVEALGKRSDNYWIDMESGVRDSNNEFSLDKCRAVCQAVYGKR